MNLIVSSRSQKHRLRFVVRGRWEYNDALTLAYQIKAAATRTGHCNVLVDLREVTASPQVEGKFLVWDRMRRVLSPNCKVAVLAPVALVDLQERHIPGAATVVLFTSERAATLWLAAVRNPEPTIKNPPVLRSEGQIAGKET